MQAGKYWEMGIMGNIMEIMEILSQQWEILWRRNIFSNRLSIRHRSYFNKSEY